MSLAAFCVQYTYSSLSKLTGLVLLQGLVLDQVDDVAGDQLPVVARVGGHLLLGDVGAVPDGEHVLGLTALQEQGGSDLESVVEVDLRRVCRERGKTCCWAWWIVFDRAKTGLLACCFLCGPKVQSRDQALP